MSAFNGAPAEITLPDLNLKLTEGGGLNAFGLDIPGVAIPLESLKPLTDAGIGSLSVKATDKSIDLAVNGQALPTINFTPAATPPLRVSSAARRTSARTSSTLASISWPRMAWLRRSNCQAARQQRRRR